MQENITRKAPKNAWFVGFYEDERRCRQLLLLLVAVVGGRTDCRRYKSLYAAYIK
jgi:hypothetical protein